MSRSVVVTGMGTIGPTGAGVEPLREALRTGRVTLVEVDRSEGYHATDSARLAGLVPPRACEPWLSAKDARRMSSGSRMAVSAALMAVESSGLAPEEVAGPDTAVCLGTVFGPTGFTARLLEQLNEAGPLAISPFLFMETVANAYAGQVALRVGAQGPNYTITQREASALLAVARGAALVASGRVRRALVGTVDEVSPILHAVLGRFGSLARAEREGGPETPRVFDADRAGFVASEGSTVLVLEDEAAARERGASILGRVRGAVRANDPTAPASDWGAGHERLAEILEAGLRRLDLSPRGFDRIVSGASGSRRGDRVEALSLRALYGDEDLPTILAPKSVTGEYGGGFLASAVLSLAGGSFAPTPGFRRRDQELAVLPHAGAPLEPARRTLVSSLGAGGSAAWLVLEGGLQ